MRTHWWLAALLLAVGVLTHGIALDQPRQVIFDETHFGKFVTAYCCTGERFFDIHPPHTKLLIAGTAWLSGYRGGFSFESIGQQYSLDVPVAGLRLVSAVSGVFLPLLVFLLIWQLGGSPALAFLGGWLVLFDTALTLQTRLLALDGVLLVATFGSVSAWLVATRRQRWSWGWLVLSGALAGLAAGTKFTGLAALALLGVLWLARFWRQPRQDRYRWVQAGFVVVGAAAVVYLAGWAAHFMLVPLPGPGDAFHVPDFHTAPLPVSFFRELWELHRVMLGANYNLEATHPYASHWWTWPFMQRPVFYWQGEQSLIYFLGNPLVWWGGSLLFLIAVFERGIAWVRRERRSGAAQGIQMWIPAVGFLIAFLPLVRVPRALFLYHYLMPLLFALIAGVLWLGQIGFMQRQPAPTWQRWLYGGMLAGAAILFIWFSPLVYGLPLEPLRPGWLFWFESWI